MLFSCYEMERYSASEEDDTNEAKKNIKNFGDELKYITEAYETNWMSTVGANINSAEAEIAAKGSDPHYSYQKRCYLRGRGTSCIQIMG